MIVDLLRETAQGLLHQLGMLLSYGWHEYTQAFDAHPWWTMLFTAPVVIGFRSGVFGGGSSSGGYSGGSYSGSDYSPPSHQVSGDFTIKDMRYPYS